MHKDIKMILTLLNVFSNYAYFIKISNLYSYFYYGKTSKKKTPKIFKWGKMGVFM